MAKKQVYQRGSRSIKSLKCKHCESMVNNVSVEAESVVCSSCVIKMCTDPNFAREKFRSKQTKS